MSYSGIVTKIKIRPHPNADKLAIGQCGAYQVVVSKDTPDLTMGVFFPVDGQLSPEFCKEHDLIARKDEQGNKAGGYFSENRKVRCQKLRGEKSEGFWMPINCLNFTGDMIGYLKEGEEITTVNGIEICRKYLTPATLKAMGNKNTKPRRQVIGFPKHFDTESFKKESWKIPPGVCLYVTEKLHGSSQRFAFAFNREVVDLPWYKRLINKILNVFPTEKSEYIWVNGTRNVVLETRQDPLQGYHGNEGFRFRMSDPVKGLLNKGEVIYGEIVGYTGNGEAPIMGTLPVKDPEQQKKYGKTMTFSYGNEVGQCSFYVYRITHVNEDGVAVDLPHDAVVKRCETLGLKMVPLVIPPFIFDGNVKALEEKLSAIIENNPSTLDSKHCMEGVVVRWESYPTCKALKLKSFVFLGAEDEKKSDDTYVDAEEIS